MDNRLMQFSAEKQAINEELNKYLHTLKKARQVFKGLLKYNSEVHIQRISEIERTLVDFYTNYKRY